MGVLPLQRRAMTRLAPSRNAVGLAAVPGSAPPSGHRGRQAVGQRRPSTVAASGTPTANKWLRLFRVASPLLGTKPPLPADSRVRAAQETLDSHSWQRDHSPRHASSVGHGSPLLPNSPPRRALSSTEGARPIRGGRGPETDRWEAVRRRETAYGRRAAGSEECDTMAGKASHQ